MKRDMDEHEEIAKVLKTRLSELRTHLANVDHELHKRLPADSEDQAIELENQEALEAIKKTETTGRAIAFEQSPRPGGHCDAGADRSAAGRGIG
jgi:hypothetical protein